jgi:hypothetical protein
MTAYDFRGLVLAHDGAIEGQHMGHPDFRANGRVFASLHSADRFGMVKLQPEEQRVLLDEHPETFEPSAGAWGRQGCTNVKLATASKAAVRGAVRLAFDAIVALPPAKARKKPGAKALATKAGAAARTVSRSGSRRPAAAPRRGRKSPS